MQNIENSWYRISIKALIYNEEWKFLLCREKNGTWDLPWGWLDHGEQASICLIRELHEEMWLKVTAISKEPKYFITAHKPNSTTRPWVANICYEVEVTNLDFTQSEECVEIWFFTAKDIPHINVLENVKELAKYM